MGIRCGRGMSGGMGASKRKWGVWWIRELVVMLVALKVSIMAKMSIVHYGH